MASKYIKIISIFITLALIFPLKSYSSEQKHDIPTGTFIWSKTSEKLKFYYLNDLLLDFGHDLHYDSFKERKKICASSSSLGLKYWRPATKQEREMLKTKINKLLYGSYNLFRRGPHTASELVLNTYNTFPCVHETMTFDKLYNVVFNSLNKVSIPSPPVKNNVELSKGEFEKTVNFEARKKTATQKANKSYQWNLKLYQDQVADLKATQIKQKTDYEFRMQALSQAFHIYNGSPITSDISYDADDELMSFTLQGLNYKHKISQDIAIEFAKKYKDLIVGKTNGKRTEIFQPSVIVSYSENGFAVKGIKELLSPESSVIQKEYENSLGSVVKLQNFIKEYPSAPQLKEANNQITVLKQEALAKRRSAEGRAKKLAAQEESDRQAYRERKPIGTRICKPGRVALGLFGVTITGFVEHVSGDQIQIRISDTEEQSIRYNGVSLRNGTLIWDLFSNWKSCR